MKFRMEGFQRREFRQPEIEIPVRHDRIRIDVVRPIRAIQQITKITHPHGLVRGISHG
jgi:hypothetical protein